MYPIILGITGGFARDKQNEDVLYLDFLVHYNDNRKPAHYPYKLRYPQVKQMYGILGRELKRLERAKRKLNC